MGNWSCDQQVCASCRYYGGRREIDFTGSFYEATESTGVCYGPHGSFRGCEMGEGASCSEWEVFKKNY